MMVSQKAEGSGQWAVANRQSGALPPLARLFNDPMTQWINDSTLFWRSYAEDCGTGGSGSFTVGGPNVPCARADLFGAPLPLLVLLQRENSWQYLATSRAASLRADSCSGDKSGEESVSIYPSMGDGIIPPNAESSSRSQLAVRLRVGFGVLKRE
jgi:hypothetical protein